MTDKNLTQSDEGRELVLDRTTAGATTQTATGAAAKQHSDDEDPNQIDSHPKDHEVEGDPKPDYAGKPGKNAGLQKEEAIYTVNGTTDPMTVPSPSGPQPVGAVTSTKDEAEQALETARLDQDEDEAEIKEQREQTKKRIEEDKAAAQGRPNPFNPPHQTPDDED
jgi:hypothetical protein